MKHVSSVKKTGFRGNPPHDRDYTGKPLDPPAVMHNPAQAMDIATDGLPIKTDAELLADMAAQVEKLKRENDMLTQTCIAVQSERDKAQDGFNAANRINTEIITTVEKLRNENMKLATAYSDMMDERDNVQGALRAETARADDYEKSAREWRKTADEHANRINKLNSDINEANTRLFQVRDVAHAFELRATAAEAVLAAQKPARPEPTVTVPVSVIQGHQGGAMANGSGYSNDRSWYQP